MALFTIADLHLSHGVDKPMDVFGGRWQGYMEKIEKNWRAIVSEQDTVVVGGDISWGINFAEMKEDFLFLQHLPGKKILLKGNHDLWWNTMRKMQQFLQEHQIDTIDFLFNNAFLVDRTAICGTRGWFFEENYKEAHDEKIFKRELQRLETSLKAGVSLSPDAIDCFLHYPPLYINFRCDEILTLLKQYGVRRCIYGHLHGEALRYAVEGIYEGIEFRLVSADYLRFAPMLLQKDPS